MRIVAWLVATILALAATACSTSKSSPGKSAIPTSASGSGKTMPNVTGQKLDNAEDAIENAGGDPDKVKEIGGGKLGIVVKSNWTVCSQVPAAGEALPASPQLTVKRSCDSPSSSPTSSSPPPSSASSSEVPATPALLTIKNSNDLATLLKVGDGCDAPVGAFATKYAGRNIKFDGSVSAVSPSDGGTYNILVAPGNEGASSSVGPNLQFQGVSDVDLGPAGSDALEVGAKLQITAAVGEYSGEDSCLLALTPISIQDR